MAGGGGKRSRTRLREKKMCGQTRLTPADEPVRDSEQGCCRRLQASCKHFCSFSSSVSSARPQRARLLSEAPSRLIFCRRHEKSASTTATSRRLGDPNTSRFGRFRRPCSSPCTEAVLQGGGWALGSAVRGPASVACRARCEGALTPLHKPQLLTPPARTDSTFGGRGALRNGAILRHGTFLVTGPRPCQP